MDKYKAKYNYAIEHLNLIAIYSLISSIQTIMIKMIIHELCHLQQNHMQRPWLHIPHDLPGMYFYFFFVNLSNRTTNFNITVDIASSDHITPRVL